MADSPREEILRAYHLLMRRGDVREVRIPKADRRGTISGYFNNPELLVEAVLRLDGVVEGIYITLNPVNPALLARAANRFHDHAKFTTSDVQIVRRCWMLIDFDPVRPAGISSTDDEHGRAITAASAAAFDDLRGAGMGDPVVADSGNGAHLLYPLELPNDRQTTDLVKKVLAGIAAQCGTDDVAVDLTVFNAARIVKLYGTMACKGDNLPERPQPPQPPTGGPTAPGGPVMDPRDPLEKIASWAPEQQAPTGEPQPARSGGFNLEVFINAHLRVRRGPLPWGGRGLKWELEVCPFNAEHTGGCAVITTADGVIGFRCQHNSCSNYGWRDVRALFEKARQEFVYGARSTPVERAPGVGSLVIRCLADIQTKPVHWLRPGRIARGKVSMLAGNPDLGKSQVTASMAGVVTTGGQWPVDRTPCPPGDVIFLNAEDAPDDTLRPRVEAAGANLQRVHFIESVIVGYTASGAERRRSFCLEQDMEILDDSLSQLPNVALVVIDPISAYLGRIDSHRNSEVRGLLAPLSEVAARHNVAILGLSHLTKAGGHLSCSVKIFL
jgi:hypothetical protein